MNQQKLEKQKHEKYNPSSLFYQPESQQDYMQVSQENSSETSLIEIKKSFFIRFINFIKSLFKR